MSRSVLVLNGPNLNLLGTREPEIYGRQSLEDVVASLHAVAPSLGMVVRHVQSNSEGGLISAVHEAAATGCVGAVVNAGGYTHTSVALRDAFVGTQLPFVEVHLSNVWKREAFRHVSLLSDVAIGVIGGFGPLVYELGLRALGEHVRQAGASAGVGGDPGGVEV